MAEIKLSELIPIKDRVDLNTEPLQEMVNEIVKKYCGALDEYMSKVDDILCSGNEPPTKMLEDMLLNIDSLLYWTGNGLEEATIKESMSKMITEEQYNTEYNKAEGTIGDKKAVAQLNSQKEAIIKLCYSNAVNLYKHKISMATEMASSLKKVITHRITEYSVNRIEIQ